MINSSPRNYAYVEAVRPVLDGRDFLSRANQIGRNVLGEEVVSSLEFLAINDDTGGQSSEWIGRSVAPTTEPVMVVTDSHDLTFVLSHRSGPRGLTSRSQIGYVTGKLHADSVIDHQKLLGLDGRAHRAKITLPNLAVVLDDLAYAHNEDPNATPMHCGPIIRLDVPGSDIILGLSPDPEASSTRLLEEQADAVDERIRIISDKVGVLPSFGRLTAPFARVPGDISQARYDLLLDELNEERPFRLTLGAVQYRSES